MLESIKELINQKQEFLEAAQFIFEDVVSGDLDDRIILGESNDEDDDDDSEDKNDHDDDDDDDEKKEIGDTSDDPVLEDDTEEVSEPESDLLGASIDGADISTSTDTPSGDPIIDPIDDILSVQINLASNTISDVLPVPPGNAGEAIGGAEDLLAQRIDSGFEEGPVDPSDDDIMTEAITLGDESTTPPPDDVATADAVPEDAAAPATAEAEPENEVTAAVKDKVAEADAPPVDGDGETGGAKDELLKKLGSITKSLEDAKRAVMNSVQ